MRLPVAMMILMLPLQAKAKDCSKHPIYCQILKNSPNINKGYAFRLSNVIYVESSRHKIPADLLTAILMQESSYKLDAKNCMRGVPEGYPLTEDAVKVCQDFGISQIHYKTAKLYGFDKDKLLNNLNYSVSAGAKVLGWFRSRYSRKEPLRWYCRYNTGTASASKIKKNCTKYIRLVERWR